jgi:hypothetical protein
MSKHPGLNVDTDVRIDCRGLVHPGRVSGVVQPLYEEREDAGVVFGKGDADGFERTMTVALV